MLQDVRYAWRSLSKSRGFAAIAVTCLALGIGINATIFSVVDGVMLQPYPYADAERIVVLSGRNQRLHVNRAGISYPDYRDIRDENSTLSAVAAFGRRSLTISDGTSEPERYDGSTVTWNLFELLGIRVAAQAADVLRRFFAVTGIDKIDDLVDDSRAGELVDRLLVRLGRRSAH